MKYKHIEASRELRLWIVQVIVPTTVFLAAVPEAREWIGDKVNQGKTKLKEKVSRK